MVNAGGLDTSLSDAIDHTHQRGNPARQQPIRRHHRPPHAEPPRPRRPLDLLLVAVEAESFYQDIRRTRRARRSSQIDEALT